MAFCASPTRPVLPTERRSIAPSCLERVAPLSDGEVHQVDAGLFSAPQTPVGGMTPSCRAAEKQRHSEHALRSGAGKHERRVSPHLRERENFWQSVGESTRFGMSQNSRSVLPLPEGLSLRTFSLPLIEGISCLALFAGRRPGSLPAQGQRPGLTASNANYRPTAWPHCRRETRLQR